MRLLVAAYGIGREETGVERLAVKVANTVAAQGHGVAVLVDEDAAWPNRLSERIDVLARKPHLLGVSRPAPYPMGFDAWYSVGPPPPPPLLLGRRPQRSAYTVHDWGPFLDPDLSVRSRLSWGSAIIQAAARSHVLHSLLEEIPNSTPTAIRRIRRKGYWIVDSTIANPSAREEASHSLPGILAEEPFVLFVGTNTRRKRLPLLVKAAEYCTGFNIALAGAGTEDYIGLHNVVALGRVPEDVLCALYEACRAVVLVSSYEGFGIPIVEGVANGKPVAVSERVYEMHKSQSYSRALHIVPCDTPQGLAQALQELVSYTRVTRWRTPSAGTENSRLLGYLLAPPS